jgi:hypothetical protein
VAHTGGERIIKGSAEETALRSWVDTLAALKGAELASALRYKQEESAGHGAAITAVFAAADAQPVQPNRSGSPARYDESGEPVSAGGLRQRLQEPIPGTVDFAVARRSLRIAAERLAANAFRRGDSKGIIPCQPRSDSVAECESKFITGFGRSAFRRPLDPRRSCALPCDLRAETGFLKGAQAVIEAMLQSPNFLFRLEETPNPKWKPYAAASRLSYFLWDTMPDAALLESAGAEN